LKSISEQKAFLVLLLLLGCVFLFLLKPVLIPVLLASILVLLIYPVYDSISKKLKKPHLASFITTLLILLILIIPLSLVMIMVINQSIDFFSNLDISRFFSYLISSDFEQKWIVPLDSFLKSNFNLVLDIAGLSKKIAAETAKYVYSYSPAVLGQTATFIFSFLVMHVSIYFLFVEGKQVFKILMDLSPLEVKHEQRLTSELRNMVMATVYGYLVTALFQAFLAGLLIFSGFEIFYLSNPFGEAFRLDIFSFPLFGQEISLLSALLVAFWLILIINAFNWLDGVDGLAGGVGLFGFLALLFLSISALVNQPPLGVLSVAMAVLWNFS